MTCNCHLCSDDQSNIRKELGMSMTGTAVSRKVDARAEEIRKSDTTMTKEQALARAYRELPQDEFEALRAHERDEAVRKAEDEELPAATPVPELIQKAADEVRARRGSTHTREQAIAAALRENPELAELWRR